MGFLGFLGLDLLWQACCLPSEGDRRFLRSSGKGILANDYAVSRISRDVVRGVHFNGGSEHLEDEPQVTWAITFMACEAARA